MVESDRGITKDLFFTYPDFLTKIVAGKKGEVPYGDLRANLLYSDKSQEITFHGCENYPGATFSPFTRFSIKACEKPGYISIQFEFRSPNDTYTRGYFLHIVKGSLSCNFVGQKDFFNPHDVYRNPNSDQFIQNLNDLTITVEDDGTPVFKLTKEQLLNIEIIEPEFSAPTFNLSGKPINLQIFESVRYMLSSLVANLEAIHSNRRACTFLETNLKLT